MEIKGRSLMILEFMLKQPERRFEYGELSSDLQISRTNMSNQIKPLVDSNLVHKFRMGNQHYIALTEEGKLFKLSDLANGNNSDIELLRKMIRLFADQEIIAPDDYFTDIEISRITLLYKEGEKVNDK